MRQLIPLALLGALCTACASGATPPATDNVVPAAVPRPAPPVAATPAAIATETDAADSPGAADPASTVGPSRANVRAAAREYVRRLYNEVDRNDRWEREGLLAELEAYLAENDPDGELMRDPGFWAEAIEGSR